MPRRKRSGTTEPLRRLAEHLEALRQEADRLLEADQPDSEEEDAPPRLTVAAPAPGSHGKTIAQRARDASSLFDTGREELLISLEAQIAKRLAPLLERLDIPRRGELDDLARRVADLERRLATAVPGSGKPRKRRT